LYRRCIIFLTHLEEKEQKKLSQELERQEKAQQRLTTAMEKKNTSQPKAKGKKRKATMEQIAQLLADEGCYILCYSFCNFNTYSIHLYVELCCKDDNNEDAMEVLEEQPAVEQTPHSTTSLFQLNQENPIATVDSSTVSTTVENVALTSCISYGARGSRNAYSKNDLHVAALLNRCIKSAYSQWLRSAESKNSSSRHKRDTYSTLRLSCQQAGVDQLNYSQYKSNYKALLDLHNIELSTNGDGGEKSLDPASISSSLQRAQFLERFMNALMDQLCGHGSSSMSLECLLSTFTAAIDNLPESY
jgi:hypothetical protein